MHPKSRFGSALNQFFNVVLRGSMLERMVFVTQRWYSATESEVIPLALCGIGGRGSVLGETNLSLCPYVVIKDPVVPFIEFGC